MFFPFKIDILKRKNIHQYVLPNMTSLTSTLTCHYLVCKPLLTTSDHRCIVAHSCHDLVINFVNLHLDHTQLCTQSLYWKKHWTPITPGLGEPEHNIRTGRPTSQILGPMRQFIKRFIYLFVNSSVISSSGWGMAQNNKQNNLCKSPNFLRPHTRK